MNTYNDHSNPTNGAHLSIEPLEKESSTEQAALDYTKHGWHVMSIYPPVGERCSCTSNECDSPGKHPLTQHGFKDATLREDFIRTWFTKWPQANIGIACGPSDL